MESLSKIKFFPYDKKEKVLFKEIDKIVIKINEIVEVINDLVLVNTHDSFE